MQLDEDLPLYPVFEVSFSDSLYLNKERKVFRILPTLALKTFRPITTTSRTKGDCTLTHLAKESHPERFNKGLQTGEKDSREKPTFRKLDSYPVATFHCFDSLTGLIVL